MSLSSDEIQTRNALILRWHKTGAGYRTIAAKLVAAGYPRIGWTTVRDVVKREELKEW